jgi:FMN reductase
LRSHVAVEAQGNDIVTRVVGILGSVTPPGRLSRALAAALAAARDLDPSIDTDLIDLGEYRIGFADGRPLEQLEDDTTAIVKRVQDATGVILASPVYRGSFTGVLKNLLDLLPVEALQAKPCGILAMGASQHHYLGVDWHLRAVLAWFGALVAPVSVYLTSADFSEGVILEPARNELNGLAGAVLAMERAASSLGPGELGPPPLAARRG